MPSESRASWTVLGPGSEVSPGAPWPSWSRGARGGSKTRSPGGGRWSFTSLAQQSSPRGRLASRTPGSSATDPCLSKWSDCFCRRPTRAGAWTRCRTCLTTCPRPGCRDGMGMTTCTSRGLSEIQWCSYPFLLFHPSVSLKNLEPRTWSLLQKMKLRERIISYLVLLDVAFLAAFAWHRFRQRGQDPMAWCNWCLPRFRLRHLKTDTCDV